MKTFKLFFAFTIITLFTFSSCTKDAALETPEMSDTEIMSSLYNAAALNGKGKIDADKVSFTVDAADLPVELVEALKDKRDSDGFKLNADINLSAERAAEIWGTDIENTPLKNGAILKDRNIEVKQTYMSPDGEDLTDLVADDPTIVSKAAGRLDYVYVEQGGGIIITDTEIIIYEYTYVEWCTIIW